ncbi:hypothetical protein PSSHI_12170 [Photobacterium sp. R1]
MPSRTWLKCNEFYRLSSLIVKKADKIRDTSGGHVKFTDVKSDKQAGIFDSRPVDSIKQGELLSTLLTQDIHIGQFPGNTMPLTI